MREIRQPHRPTPYLQIRNVTKTFGRFVALDSVSLDVYPGEFICFLGPSGCGKTTLLRIIAGLEEQNSGEIIQNGVDISRFPPSRRDFGIVFQSYALFPNLTAAQNVAYGLESSRRTRQEVQARVQELLTLVGLPDAAPKYPAQLSGGQQQRIALARALALSPGLLLLDEPLSALDARVRASLRGEVTQLHRRLGITTIMVTHDQEEALTMADRIVVMDHGRIAQVGTPQEIYQFPQQAFVADFVGVMNFLRGVVTNEGTHVQIGDFTIPVANLDGVAPGKTVRVAIRPEDIVIVEQPRQQNGVIKVRLQQAEFLGPFYRLHLEFNSVLPMSSRPAINGAASAVQNRFVADLPAELVRRIDTGVGTELFIRLPEELIQIFPVDGNA
jgi:iron(III) transport system ATP-binding protein